MKFEKERVSVMRSVITNMRIGVYDSQEDLMKAVLEVLCSTGDSAKYQFKNKFSYLDFSNDRVILNLLDLSRTKYGTVVEKDDYNAINSEDRYNTLEA